MLQESCIARHIPGEPMRRWFCSHEQDLYVWYAEDGRITAFQLCYAKSSGKRAVYWRDFGHARSGDDEGRHTGTPLLLADGVFDKHGVLAEFRHLSAGLPADIREFVLARIDEYASPALPSASKKPWWRFW